MIPFIIGFTFVALAVASPVNYAPDDCVIDIDYRNGTDWKDLQPLILKDSQKQTFLYSDNNDRLLRLPSGRAIYLECPGKGNYLNVTGKPSGATATCLRGKTFLVDETPYNVTSLTCKSLPRHEARRFGKCLRNGTLVKVGFEVANDFLPTFEICRDDETYVTYYSKVQITRRIANYQSGFPRPYWLAGKFFGKVNVQDAYRMDRQLETVAQIVKSEELAAKYVKKGVSFMSRGHLTAKADFVYGAQQMTTFWYVNAAPQWQSFNGGNWNELESSVRRYAAERDLDLTVYTGVHGQMTVKDAKGKSQPLYLHVNGTQRELPVPLFYWKVVYDPQSRNATAFVGVNDPHRQRITASLFLCRDVSQRIEWLTWSPRDIKAGVSYACTVNDLRKSVPTVPALPVRNLLV